MLVCHCCISSKSSITCACNSREGDDDDAGLREVTEKIEELLRASPKLPAVIRELTSLDITQSVIITQLCGLYEYVHNQ